MITMTMSSEIKTEVVLAWKAENVVEWLVAIGLEKYANKFKRHMVTGPVLLQLDDTLLDDLNITSVDDREVLLKSVGHFTGSVDECLQNHEALSSNSENENENESKTTKFTEFPELLPTIGEEDEVEESEKNQSNEATEKSMSLISNEERLNQEPSPEFNEDDKGPTDKKMEDITLAEEMRSCSTDEPSSPDRHDSDVASRATQIVQVISEENMCLRKQLEKCCQEIRHLQNVEEELQNSQMMYKDLKSAFINREHKEKAMRLRLEAEIAQLQNINIELTEQLRKAEDMNPMRPQGDLKKLTDMINKRDEEIEQLQKEGKVARTSLQNVERLLKQKSSEIINLRQQLERFDCNLSGSELELKQLKEKRSAKSDNIKKFASLHDLGQIWRQTYTRDAQLHGKLSDEKPKCQKQSSEYNVSTCVPILVELLKEKDAKVASLRNEIKQITSRPTGETNEDDSLDDRDKSDIVFHEVSSSCETYNTKDAERRYSDLEAAIKSLHVQLAEKDAVIKILQCKYGENEVNSCQDSSSRISTPVRSPSFTSQVSSVSSYEDSGIVAPSDYNNGEMSRQHGEGVTTVERYIVRKKDIDTESNQRLSTTHQEDKQLIDHCWFV